MTSPEFQASSEPVDLSAEIAELMNNPDESYRRMALPHEVAPAATDYLNGVEDVVMSETIRRRFVTDEHEELLAKLRKEVTAAHEEVEDADPEVAALQARITEHLITRQIRTGGVASGIKPKHTVLKPVSVNPEYL